MTELEAKFWPVHRATLAQKLNSLGNLRFSSLMRTRYFLFQQSEQDSLFRLREIGGSAFLASKGPRQHRDVKAREEHETAVDDADAAVEMVYYAGGRAAGPPEERWRQEWILPGDVAVAIDRLADPRVPDYCEIEGPDGDIIFRTAEALGLGEANRGAQTFNELAGLFGVSNLELLRPLAEEVKAGFATVEPERGHHFAQGSIEHLWLFPVGEDGIVIEACRTGGRVSWPGNRMEVEEPAAIAGFLAQAGMKTKNGD